MKKRKNMIFLKRINILYVCDSKDMINKLARGKQPQKNIYIL